MTSCDTNVLFGMVNADSPGHVAITAFMQHHRSDQRFLLCEQVLTELYCLLRNPVVTHRPLDAVDAVALIQRFRTNPAWRVVDVPGEARIMDKVWQDARRQDLAYRRIFNLRLAATLRHHGVRYFATRNIRDFADLGFERVWDPTGNGPVT